MAFFVGAAALIALAAKPFADGLVHGGRQLGVDEFLLVEGMRLVFASVYGLFALVLLALRWKSIGPTCCALLRNAEDAPPGTIARAPRAG